MIYFLQTGDGRAVKIGLTENVQTRQRDLQSANPYPLVLLATMPGGLTKERELHRRFQAGRITGEWFRYSTPGLADFIAGLRHQEDLRDQQQAERIQLLAEPDDFLLKAREVGAILRLSTGTVLDWWEEGKLPGFRLNGQAGPVRFRLGDIRNLLQSRYQPARAKDRIEELPPGPDRIVGDRAPFRSLYKRA